jgi:hypothetical protein
VIEEDPSMKVRISEEIKHKRKRRKSIRRRLTGDFSSGDEIITIKSKSTRIKP